MQPLIPPPPLAPIIRHGGGGGDYIYMGDFMSTVRVKILNLLKPVLICSKSQQNNRKKFLYSNPKISKF